MSRNLKLFLSAGFLFYLAGSMNEAPALYVMAGICLACILGCYVISRMGVSGLKLSVGVPAAIVPARRAVAFKIELENIGMISRPSVPIRIYLRNTTITTPAKTYTFTLPGLASGQSVQTSGEFTPAVRGEYLLADPQIIGIDPLGMFSRPGIAAHSVAFTCVPAPVPITRADMTNMLSERAQLQLATLKARRGEFFGIRPHEPGDELRDVHWKMAAHTGELVVKEYAGGRDYHAAIWIDTCTANVIGSGVTSSFELQLTAAASTAKALSDIGLDTQVFGEGLPISLRSPDRGQSTYQRILLSLAQILPNGHRRFGENMREWASQMRSGVTVFIITSGIEAAAIEQACALAVRGVGVRVLLCNTEDNTATTSDTLQKQALARLRANGIPSSIASSTDELQEAFTMLGAMRTIPKHEVAR